MRLLFSLLILFLLQSCLNFKLNKSQTASSDAEDKPSGAEIIAAPKLCAEESGETGCEDTPTLTPPTGEEVKETVILVPDESQTLPAETEVFYENQVTPTQKVNCEDVKLDYTSHRSGTITLSGKTDFIPGQVSQDKYNSEYFSSIPAVQKFLDSKTERFVRFKVRPSPKAGCFNQKEIKDKETPWGYTVLSYRVGLIPLTEKGELLKEKDQIVLKHPKTFETSTYTCSKPHHLNVNEKTFPHGFVMAITEVSGDQACWYHKGKNKCKGFTPLPENRCWQMDVEFYSVNSAKELSEEEELELEEYGSEK